MPKSCIPWPSGSYTVKLMDGQSNPDWQTGQFELKSVLPAADLV